MINSSSQCGRSSIIKLDTCDSLESFLQKYEDTYLLDFSKTYIDDKKNEINTFVLGCEGGFSSSEREFFLINKKS